MEQLKKTDVEKAKEIAWESMLSKAQGEKPKDDVAKLKKSIGKDKAKKKKSTAEWYE